MKIFHWILATSAVVASIGVNAWVKASSDATPSLLEAANKVVGKNASMDATLTPKQDFPTGINNTQVNGTSNGMLGQFGRVTSFALPSILLTGGGEKAGKNAWLSSYTTKDEENMVFPAGVNHTEGSVVIQGEGKGFGSEPTLGLHDGWDRLFSQRKVLKGSPTIPAADTVAGKTSTGEIDKESFKAKRVSPAQENHTRQRMFSQGLVKQSGLEDLGLSGVLVTKEELNAGAIDETHLWQDMERRSPARVNDKQLPGISTEFDYQWGKDTFGLMPETKEELSTGKSSLFRSYPTQDEENMIFPAGVNHTEGSVVIQRKGFERSPTLTEATYGDIGSISQSKVHQRSSTSFSSTYEFEIKGEIHAGLSKSETSHWQMELKDFPAQVHNTQVSVVSQELDGQSRVNNYPLPAGTETAKKLAVGKTVLNNRGYDFGPKSTVSPAVVNNTGGHQRAEPVTVLEARGEIIAEGQVDKASRKDTRLNQSARRNHTQQGTFSKGLDRIKVGTYSALASIFGQAEKTNAGNFALKSTRAHGLLRSPARVNLTREINGSRGTFQKTSSATSFEPASLRQAAKEMVAGLSKTPASVRKDRTLSPAGNNITQESGVSQGSTCQPASVSSSVERISLEGPTYSVTEPNILEEFMKAVSKMKSTGEYDRRFNDSKEVIRNRLQNPPPVEGLSKAVEVKTRPLEVSIPETLPEKLLREAANVPMPRINRELLFIDGNDLDSLKAARFLGKNLPNMRVVLVSGDISKTSRILNRRIFFDQAGALKRQFGFNATPALLYNGSDGPYIAEFPATEPKSALQLINQ